MTILYPHDHDVFTTIPAATHQVDPIGSRTHRVMHNDAGDAIEAIEAELGVRGSGIDGLSSLANSGMNIWQAGTTFTSIANATWGPDNWIYRKSGGVVHDLLRSTDVPTVAASFHRAAYSLHLDCTAISGTLAAGDFSTIATRLEGQSFRRFAEQLWTIGFWVKATKTGRHYVYVTNSGEDRSCVCAYDINVTDTWEYHIAQFPVSPTAGTWDYDTGRGLEIGWCLAAGTTYHATLNQTWQSGLVFGRSDQVNDGDNTANNFRIALVGRPTLGTAPARYRPVDLAVEELRCWRYFYQFSGEQIGSAATGTLLYTDNSLLMPVPMRATPTVSGASFAASAGSNGTASVSATSRRVLRAFNSAANWTVNANIAMTAAVAARIP